MNKFLKSIGGFSLGPIIGAVFSFITVPVTTHFISPEEYGKASMFALAQSMISAVIYLGMDQAFVREFNIMRDNIKKLLYNAIIIPMGLALTVSIFILLFHQNASHILFDSDDEFLPVLSLALLLPLMVVETFALLNIRMEEKGLLYSFFTIFLKAIVLLLTVLFLSLYEKSFRVVVYAAALGEIITSIILYILIIRKHNFSRELLDWDLQKRMLKFGAPLVPAFAVGLILTSMDKVMLRSICTYSELGLYSAAFKIVSVLGVLQACFTLYWTPVAYRWYQEGKSGDAFQNISKIVAILLTVVAIGILLLKEIVAIILGTQFRNAIDIFPFLLLYPVLYTLSETTGVGIGFKRKTAYSIVITSIAGITNIALNWLLIPMFNGTGAAMATGISYIAFFWGRTLISRKLWYKFDLKIYVFSNIILLSNCAIHTFMKGYFPYLFSFITLLAIIIYFSVYVKKNDFIVKLRRGEMFE